MPGASSVVSTQFSTANNYARAAETRANSFISSLNSVVAALRTPDLQLAIDWPAAPALTQPTAFTPSSVPTEFPSLDIGEAPEAPEIEFSLPVAPLAPNLPDYNYSPSGGSLRPILDELTGVTLPDRPDAWVPPTPPTLLNINIRSFEGVDSHGDWVAQLSTMPNDLVLAPPSGFVAPQVNKYDSALLTDVINLLRARAAGGTGLAPSVEQALWDRARSRDAAAAAVNVAEIVKNAESRGFSLPPGAMHAMLRDATKTVLGKSAEISRDIAIKQAELEQQNARDAIAQGIQLESQLIEYTNSIEQRTFDAAKFAASQAVEIYNAIVAQYRVVLEKYSIYAGIYRSLIEGEKAKVDVYRAEVDAERAKVDINKSLIDQRRSEIEARNAQIELYKSEIEAAQAVLAADKLKIEAFGERVRAYAAEINAETARVEAFKAQLQGNVARADIYKTQVDAFESIVNATTTGYKTQAELYDTRVRSYLTQTQAYAASVNAEAEKVRALISIEELGIEGAKLDVQTNTSNNQTQIENYRALLAQYEAAKQIAISSTKLLSDNYMTLKSMVTDAAKVGAQVNAQMAASAYGTVRVGADISGSDSTQVSFQYRGDTADSQSAPNLAI